MSRSVDLQSYLDKWLLNRWFIPRPDRAVFRPSSEAEVQWLTASLKHWLPSPFSPSHRSWPPPILVQAPPNCPISGSLLLECWNIELGLLFRSFHRLLFFLHPIFITSLSLVFSRRDEPLHYLKLFETLYLPQIAIILPFFFQDYPRIWKSVCIAKQINFNKFRWINLTWFDNSYQSHFERNNSLDKNTHLANCAFL